MFAKPYDSPQIIILQTNKSQYMDPLLWSNREHGDNVICVCFSWDGSMLATVSFDKSVRILDAQTGEEIWKFVHHTESVFCVAFPPCPSRLVASCSEDKTIVLWDIHSNQPKKVLSGHTGWVYSVSFSHDAKRLASSSLDETVRIWDVESGDELRSLKGHSGWIYGCRFAPSDGWVASCADDQSVRLWDSNTGEEVKKFAKHWGPVSGISFSSDGKLLASVSSDKTMRLWDLVSGTERAMIEAGTGWLYSCDFSPCGTRVACTSEDKTSRIFDVTTKTELARIFGHTASVACGRFDPTGNFFATSSEDHTIRMCDLAVVLAHPHSKIHCSHSSAVVAAVYSDDGMFALTAGSFGDITLWGVGAGPLMEIRTIQTGKTLETAFFSSDSGQIAALTDDFNVLVFEASNGVLARTYTHSCRVLLARFASPSQIVTITEDGMFHRWDVTSPSAPSKSFSVTNDTSNCVISLNTDGSVLAISSQSELKLLGIDSKTGVRESSRLQLSASVVSVRFSSAGRRLCVQTSDFLVGVYDAVTHQLVQQYQLPQSVATCNISCNGFIGFAGLSDGQLIAASEGLNNLNSIGVFDAHSRVTCIGVHPMDATKVVFGTVTGTFYFLELLPVS
eukprot:c1903_g1_i1.p1 GENE.c1903_g1_i1~~c1903_g1_i1.p1  ORF type:complete len:620 (+),score=170.44 c1903_g1_i1:1-1860(+)